MIILAPGIASHLEHHGTKMSLAPTGRTKLPRIVALLVNNIGLIKNCLCVFKTETVFLPNKATLRGVEFEAHRK